MIETHPLACLCGYGAHEGMRLLNFEQSFPSNRPVSAHQRPRVSNNQRRHHLCHVPSQWCGYPAPPRTVSIPSLSCWICRHRQLRRRIANDVRGVHADHHKRGRGVEGERERYLIWKAPVQRLRFASLWLLAESEIKAKRWATNVCFCHWRFVSVFDQQPPLSPCLTLLLICSNGLPFMRRETGGWREGCDWGEWSGWEDTLQTNRTGSWKHGIAHMAFAFRRSLGIIHLEVCGIFWYWILCVFIKSRVHTSC